MSKQPPPAPTASTVDPYPTVIQIVGRPGTESLQAPAGTRQPMIIDDYGTFALNGIFRLIAT